MTNNDLIDRSWVMPTIITITAITLFVWLGYASYRHAQYDSDGLAKMSDDALATDYTKERQIRDIVKLYGANNER